jgi:hypothetical protein
LHRQTDIFQDTNLAEKENTLFCWLVKTFFLINELFALTDRQAGNFQGTNLA